MTSIAAADADHDRRVGALKEGERTRLGAAIKTSIALVAAITAAAACWLWASGRADSHVSGLVSVERTSVHQATVQQATVQQQWCKVCTSIKLEEMPEDAYRCAESALNG